MPAPVPAKAHFLLKNHALRIDSWLRQRYSQAQIPKTDTRFGSLLKSAKPLHSPEPRLGPVELSPVQPTISLLPAAR